ncbi:MAG: hypothetical protein RSE50_00675 [Myroides sp.]
MNHFTEVKEISFDTILEAGKNKNYPSSGFFIVRTEHTSDLRFVDKNIEQNICICPESIYDDLEIGIKELPQQLETIRADVFPPEGFVSESFVLDFSKMLLSQRK